ncbi:fatty acyl-CoA reductase 1-like [Ctenocephalides felis]|uniref:fatty acyl-CoA reductase 1-like n=1 Tax=Ctenocephalides felis TaxID=7515 RepID=UPI000E6E291B|nr:fatty acyl-CoA reductase 1-like [Ctenocephalides felis]
MVVPTIPQFFKDKEIFITGGSGFLGKVLIEKILRSCPDFKVIYLLLREKKGKPIEERLEDILQNELFSLVKEKTPELFKKVVAVSGDVSQLQLGLNESDKQLVLRSEIVFHVAANVRFDDHLTKATLMNTRGTREIMELMLQMPNLVVGVHVSTTYCNTDKDTIEEKVYRDHGDWREAIRLAEDYDDEYNIACLTEKCLGRLRNTYLYTKHLAENIVEDYSDRLPLVLYRPGIVVSAWKEPIPGWADNLNGPISFNIAGAKGLLRAMYADPKLILDYTPVDVIIKGLLVATWNKVTKRGPQKNLPVYNCSVYNKFVITQERAYQIGMKMNSKTPFKNFWYPRCTFTGSWKKFWLLFFFCNIIPGFILDSLLKVTGHKPILMKILRKIYVAILALGYFATRNWDFKSDNFWNLLQNLLPEDRNDFDYDMKTFDAYEFAWNFRMGSAKYLLKEPENPAEYKKIYKRNKILYYSIVYALLGTSVYLVFSSRYLKCIVKKYIAM